MANIGNRNFTRNNNRLPDFNSDVEDIRFDRDVKDTNIAESPESPDLDMATPRDNLESSRGLMQ
jgi:hypothetical protein